MIRLAAILAIAIAPATARAQDLPSGGLRDGEHNYQIVIAAGWRPLEAPDGTLLAYQAAGGQLAITRVDVGRTGPGSNERMVADIERGVAVTRALETYEHQPA